MNGSGFLAAPPLTGEAQGMFDEDIAASGHVMNTSRLWGHRPDLYARLFELLREAGTAAGLGFRERGVLIAACASAAGDSYCALAWGSRLAEASDADTAAAVLRRADAGPTARSVPTRAGHRRSPGCAVGPRRARRPPAHGASPPPPAVRPDPIPPSEHPVISGRVHTGHRGRTGTRDPRAVSGR
ncbi:hypothetical protein GCM10010187_41660 [Actinomadura coerulea]|nr:hypothetical protein GCM10010187_41660 [Actinomadura coerulea]